MKLKRGKPSLFKNKGQIAVRSGFNPQAQLARTILRALTRIIRQKTTLDEITGIIHKRPHKDNSQEEIKRKEIDHQTLKFEVERKRKERKQKQREV